MKSDIPRLTSLDHAVDVIKIPLAYSFKIT